MENFGSQKQMNLCFNKIMLLKKFFFSYQFSFFKRSSRVWNLKLTLRLGKNLVKTYANKERERENVSVPFWKILLNPGMKFKGKK